MLPDCPCAALRVGLGVLVQTAKPETGVCSPSTGRRAEALEDYRYMDMSDAAKTDTTVTGPLASLQ